LRANKRFLVHDELGAQPGDQVRIVESKPMSKRKRWVVEEVIKKAEVAK
jgi:small subunit ribosomal protein S17